MTRALWSGVLAIAAALSAAAHPASTLEPRTEAQLEAIKQLIQHDPARAINSATQMVSRREAVDRRVGDGRFAVPAAERLIAEAHLRLGQISDAEKVIAAAERHIRRDAPRSELMGEILLTKGGVLAAREAYDEALAAYQSAHGIFSQRGIERSKAVSLIYIATLYSDARDWPSALRYLAQAQESAGADATLLSAIRNNRGIILHAAMRYAEAGVEFKHSLRLTQRLGQTRMEAQAWRNIARNAVELGQLDAADAAIARALALSGSRDEATTRSQLYAIAADVALRRGQARRAGGLIDRTFTGVDLDATGPSFRDAHDTAYRTYRALGRPAEALAHLVALRRLTDEATKLATTTGTALMRARFDYANQELRIANLRAEELNRSVAAGQAQARYERLIFAVAAGAVTLIIALLAFALFALNRSRDKVRAANADLAQTNDALGKALAAKTEFLATTSHEIRTPLNGILGMTQVMLADGGLPAATRERLTVVHDAGATMRALVDDILDVAKMEAGRLTVEQAPFDLAATLRAAAAIWAEQAAAKGLRYTIDLDAAPPTMVGDAARVRQIAFNLLGNAIKFTEAGKVGLRVAVAEDRRTVTIAVDDSGIGIAPEQQAAIFEAFRQADASTTRRFGGTGLGLSICRTLAEAMGGKIAVDSTAGCGSTFTVTLPLVESVRVAADPCAELSRVVDATLIVERGPIARSMWRTLLTPRGAPIVFADDGAAAAALLTCGGISRVLADDMAIGGDARMLATAARAAGAALTLLWPTDRIGETDALLTAGAAQVLAKPVKGAAVVAALFDEAGARTLAQRAA